MRLYIFHFRIFTTNPIFQEFFSIAKSFNIPIKIDDQLSSKEVRKVTRE